MAKVFIRPHNVNGRAFEVGDSTSDLDNADVEHLATQGIIGDGPTKAELKRKASEAKAPTTGAVAAKPLEKGGSK